MGRTRALLLFAVVTWGWTFVASKVALRAVSPVELLALRMSVGVPLLAALLHLRRVPLHLLPGERRAAGVGGLLLLAHFVIQISGIRHTSATHSAWLMAVTPVVLAVVSRVLFRERLGRGATAGIAAAAAGVVLLVSRGDLQALQFDNVGDGLVLLSTLTWSAYTVATRDLVRARDPLLVTTAVLLPVLLASGAWVLLTSNLARVSTLPSEAWAAVLFLGVVGTALSHWFWQVGVGRLGAARTGVFLYLEPVATTALAVPVLGEPLDGFTVAGGLLVLAGVAWVEHVSAAARKV